MSNNKKELLQRVTALERLAKIGTMSHKGPSIKEIEKWAQQIKDAIKLIDY